MVDFPPYLREIKALVNLIEQQGLAGTTSIADALLAMARPHG